MLKIEFNNFPTHVKLSSKKNFKINNQNLYNQKLNPHSRAKLILEMKEAFTKTILKNPKIRDLPVAMFISYYAPINYGDVRLYKTGLSWNKLEGDKLLNYEPSNDLDNMVFIWSKVIQDCLVKEGVLPEDTIKYVQSLYYKYIEIDELSDRKMVVNVVSKKDLNNLYIKLKPTNTASREELEILDILLN